MRRMVLVAVIMTTMFLASSGEASAARSSRQSQSVATRRFRPFARLIELERRKNEWLRSVFFNR
ncbi:hypothetical protein N9004_02080 [Pirellulales bacterium]|jgi:hypothetical protein|nr:hypothetical protein [Pirellulales bacterium]MDA7889563.1 hypothetical protein [Pirellulales bacterium]MDB4365697.1 hypothetical protein [Pirellulales bacterium]MDB4475523.1 hypothetical protein [Pirellulales bacterium]